MKGSVVFREWMERIYRLRLALPMERPFVLKIAGRLVDDLRVIELKQRKCKWIKCVPDDVVVNTRRKLVVFFCFVFLFFFCFFYAVSSLLAHSLTPSRFLFFPLTTEFIDPPLN